VRAFPCLELLEDRTVPSTLPAGFSEAAVGTGINSATAMEIAPNGDLWVLEQTGRVLRFHSGSTTPDVVGNLSGLGVDSQNERGVLGIAFDPSYATNKWIYIYYTTTNPTLHNRVSRFTVNDSIASDYFLVGSGTTGSDRGSTGTPTETVIFDIDDLNPLAGNHNGGAIHFGPDGKLYVAVGDNANGANAQSLTTLKGKMLRINKDGTIPTDNPFVGLTTGKDQAIWALGLRNPFTFAFQPGTGRMFINDVGELSWEEIDDGIAGSNYGWPSAEGNTGIAPTSPGTYRGPVYTYSHGNAVFQGHSITGGAFYDPTTQMFPNQYAGEYFFADFVSGWINVFDPSTGAVRQFATNDGAAVDLKVGSDGSLYYLARVTGQVMRVTYTPAVQDITPSPTDSLGGVVGTFANGGVPGIAVVGLPGSSMGTWQFSLDGGAHWMNFGTVSASTARLLGPNDKVRFVPGATYAGGASISYRSWNLTGGSDGGTVDLSAAGSTGAGTPYGGTVVGAGVVEGFVELRGNELLVIGTPGNDVFQFTAGAMPQVGLNTVLYTFPSAVQGFNFYGQGGSDTISVMGTAGNETAVVVPTWGYMSGSTFLAYWAGIQTAYVTGGGGTDTVFLYDSAGNDTFESNPSYAYLTGPGYFNWAIGFGSVYAYSTVGSDAAYLFDSAGNDTFGARPEYAYLQSSTTIDWAIGFRAVSAFSSGGSDSAALYDSAGNDAFFGSGSQGTLTLATGQTLSVTGFDLVAAFSLRGGNDTLSVGSINYTFLPLGPWM
jgi:glucose/arabinose dehydrogenase